MNIEHVQNQADDLQKKQKKNPCKKRKINQINMCHFEDVQINIVDELPWEIDGVKIYKKTSTTDFWWDEIKDGRWSFRFKLVYVKWRKEVSYMHRLPCLQ